MDDHEEARHSPPLRVGVVGLAWPMETFMERLVTGLSASGIDLTILSTERPDDQWLERHRISWCFGPRALDARSAVRQVAHRGAREAIPTARSLLGQLGRREVDLDEQFDVLYVPWINTLTADLDLMGRGVPVVTSCRGSLVTSAPWNPDRRPHRDALPVVFERARLVHCVSEQIARDAAELGLDPAKARIIRPAVDATMITPRSTPRSGSGTIHVVSVGTLSWPKDHEHGLVALRRAIDLGADLNLEIIGNGPERQHLQFAIDDLGLQERVRLLGSCSFTEVLERLSAADVYLHTSSSEGISNAVLEAMAAGLAVVTTDAGGMREVVRDDVDGILVGVRDATATGTQLARLASDASLRARLGAAGRARVAAEFRLDHQVDAFHHLFREAADR